MNVRQSILLGVLVACGAATAIAATSNAPAAAHARHFHRGEVMGEMSFMQAIHQLNLTENQRVTIKGFVATAREQERAAIRPDAAVLANPGDPGYSAAIAAAKANAVNRIQHASDLKVQIYGALSAQQQAKLPQVLNDIKAERAQHRHEGRSRDQSPGARG